VGGISKLKKYCGPRNCALLILKLMHAPWTQKMCTVDFESDGSWALERVVMVGALLWWVFCALKLLRSLFSPFPWLLSAKPSYLGGFSTLGTF
jgi:hypothetical protein